MEDHSVEAVRLVYMRACRIHLPKKPYISLAWAAFEERHGMQIIPWTLATSFCDFMNLIVTLWCVPVQLCCSLFVKLP